MRRFERRRIERLRRTAIIAGVSFGLGALADTALTWRLRQQTTPASDASTAVGPPVTGRVTQPEHTIAAREPAPVATTGRDDEARIRSTAADPIVDQLRDRDLEIPVEGIGRSDLHDTFSEARGERAHEAMDILAPRGTPVRAVEDGTVAKLFTSKAGGLTVYLFDPSRTYAYYYAHLDAYAQGLHEGDSIRRGQVVGSVGTTGNAPPDTPHLHFAIFRLTPERQWWKGEPINPYDVLK